MISACLTARAFKLTRTCDDCPWLRKTKPGQFRPERFFKLKESCEEGFGALFPCHQSPSWQEHVCVGYLLSPESRNNFRVRLALSRGKYDIRKLVARGPIYSSYVEMSAANGAKVVLRQQGSADLLQQGQQERYSVRYRKYPVHYSRVLEVPMRDWLRATFNESG